MLAASSRPAFAPITADDHAGYLWIITILGAIYTIIVALVRVYVKYRVVGIDDYLLGIATALHIAESIAVFCGLSKGLGKSQEVTSKGDWHVAGVSFLTSESLAILALCLAKCSITAIQTRVLTLKGERGWYLCWGLIALAATWGLGSILALTVRCDEAWELLRGGKISCPDQFKRWQFITSLDVFTEIVSCCIPVALTWGLNMKFKQKFQVILAFGFRLPMIALSLYHLHTVLYYHNSNNPQLAVTQSLLLLQAMLIWSLVSATIPNMRGFMKAFNSNFGMGAVQAHGGQNAYPLRTIGGSATANGQIDTRVSRRHRQSHIDSRPTSTFRPDNIQHITAIYHADGGSDVTADDEQSVSRMGSHEMIIKKDVQWSVTTSDNGKPGDKT